MINLKLVWKIQKGIEILKRQRTKLKDFLDRLKTFLYIPSIDQAGHPMSCLLRCISDTLLSIHILGHGYKQRWESSAHLQWYRRWIQCYPGVQVTNFSDTKSPCSSLACLSPCHRKSCGDSCSWTSGLILWIRRVSFFPSSPGISEDCPELYDFRSGEWMLQT